MDAKDFIMLVIRHGWPVVIAFVGYRIVNQIFDWLSQAEPAGLLRALFNRRQQHLEKMLTLPYLSRETRNLARAELNHLSCTKLTGFSDPRLQEKMAAICGRYNLPPRYFTRWRAYLSVNNDRVAFARRRYRLAWRFFVFFNLPVSTLYLGFICYLLVQASGIHSLAIILIINMALWYFPWLLLTSPVAPPLTDEMESYISRYNALQNEQ